MSITLQDLLLRSPWLNAAGMLGFSAPHGWRWPGDMGAFITNPISRLPRSPAMARTMIEYPGGVLLHTGHPNPGLQAVLNTNLQNWKRLDIPVWIHLLGDDPSNIARLVRKLEDLQDVVMAVEIDLPAGIIASEAQAMIQAAVGEMPVIAAVPLTASFETWLPLLQKAGAAAISLTAPRGCLYDRNGQAISGRLYGPSLFPLMVEKLRAALACGMAVIAGCGVYSIEDGEKLLKAGALAVQLDTVLWGPAGVF